VFFRVHAIKKATSLGVTGWIRNSKHGGSVEGEAQHKEQPKLDEFVKVPLDLCDSDRSGLGMKDLRGVRFITSIRKAYRR
jgi:acylphosphatase